MFSWEKVQTSHRFLSLTASSINHCIIKSLPAALGHNTSFDVMTDVVSSTFVQEVFTACGRCEIYTLTSTCINRGWGTGADTASENMGGKNDNRIIYLRISC